MNRQAGEQGRRSSQGVSRRSFLAGAASLGAITALGTLAGCSTEDAGGTNADNSEAPAATTPSWQPETWDHEADIVVVGCGTAGSAASIQAADDGLDVLRIEKMDWEGGCGRRSGGGVFGGPTRVQKDLGFEDNADLVYEYLVTVGEGQEVAERDWDLVDHDLIRVFADNCGATIDWLLDLGLDMNWEYNNGYVVVMPGMEPIMADGDEHPLLEGSMGYGLVGQYAALNQSDAYGIAFIPRTHVPNPAPGYEGPQTMASGFNGGWPGGTGLWKPLEEAIASRNLATLYSTSLVELIVSPDKEVVGVKATDLASGKDVSIKAKKGVVLSTDGYFTNEYLLRHYTYSRFVDPGFTGAWEGAHDGEGTIAAMAAGAGLQNMYFPGNTESMDGGLHVDREMKVLDVFGNPIPRLYAAGLVISGLKNTAGGGTQACGVHNGFALTTGRLAADSIAKLSAWE
jgi:succinate dehydrogenase/fumarate reductase flavoprotein subunit